MIDDNEEYSPLLPLNEPKKYSSLSEEILQHEINFCLFMLENGFNVIFYQERLKNAEAELERRYLLS